MDCATRWHLVMQQVQVPVPEEDLRRMEREQLLQHDVMARREVAITDLAQQYRDVQQIMTDLDVMVREQGGILNDIESNITRADQNVVRGVDELVQAKKSHRCTRTTMCYLVLAAVVIGVGVALILGLQH